MKNNIYHRTAPPVVTPEMAEAAKKAIRSIPESMPFMVSLGDQERKALQGVDVGNKVFTEDALAAARSNQAILPPYHSVARFENQISAFESMDGLIQETEKALQQMRDTRQVMGAAAYQTALSLYHYFDQARHEGVEGAEAAYQQLSVRFKGQGNFKKNGKEDPKDEPEK